MKKILFFMGIISLLGGVQMKNISNFRRKKIKFLKLLIYQYGILLK